MAFKSVAAITGVPDFKIIHIDPIETAKAFQVYLNTASKLTGVSLEDISRTVKKMPADPTTVTLVDLLAQGMRLFDAVVWLTAGRPQKYPLLEDPGMTKESIPSMHDIARAVFYCYFLLITQARYPVSKSVKDKPKIPNFLRTIMGMDQEQHEYVERICTFEPQKFDAAWARHVTFDGFGQEVISRFGLGVAGYRMFTPFALYGVKEGVDPKLLPAVKFATTMAKAKSSWDIHPLTRNPNVLKLRGNLNKNLGNLILDCFTEDQISEMVKAKVIFGKPVRELGHRNYLQWKEEDDITGEELIFRS